MKEMEKNAQMDDSKMDSILKAWKSKSLNTKFMERYRIEFERRKEERTDQLKRKQSSKPA